MQIFPNSYQMAKPVERITETPHNVLSRNYECSQVSDVFFSTQNIDLLQLGIQNKILNESNGRYRVGRQSDDELKIIMRSIYFQYAKNNIHDVKAK